MIAMRHNANPRKWRLLVAALSTMAGATAIALAVFFVELQSDKADTYPVSALNDLQADVEGWIVGADPTNIQGVVNRSDALVIAKVDEVSTRSFNVYQDGERMPIPTAESGAPQIGATQSVFELTVSQVILDDGFVERSERLVGYEPELAMLNPEVGKTYLFALLRQPDDKEHAYNPFWGMYELRDDRVARRDGSQPQIAAPESRDEFIQEFVRAASQKRDLANRAEWNAPYADLPASSQ